MLNRTALIDLYQNKKLSVKEISKIFCCSQNKVNYWLSNFNIQKRSISDALYIKANPKGDPFKIKYPQNINEAILYGIGLGLYWGEGNKRNEYSIRLGNTDPKLIKKFITFLKEIYNIDENKIKFGLQVYGDINPSDALNFWITELGYSKKHFQKIVAGEKRGGGTYSEMAKHGVLTVYFNNKRLRDILCNTIEKL